MKKFNYKLDGMCDNCPFAEEGAGLQLRLSLGRGRWQQITDDMKRGKHFLCHKTTMKGEEDDEGKYISGGGEKICGGSREYQRQLGIVSDTEQIMERLAAMAEAKHKKELKQ